MTRRYFDNWEEAKRDSLRQVERWQLEKSDSRVGRSCRARNTTSKLTPEQERELDAFMLRLPPDLLPFKKHIRILTQDLILEESTFRDPSDPYVIDFLTHDLSIQQLQVLDQQFGLLFTDEEFDDRVRRGLPVD